MNELKLLAGILLALIHFDAMAQDNGVDADLRTVKITDTIYMIEGMADDLALTGGDLSNFSGGNIGLSIGEDGVLIIDAKMAVFADRILAAIQKLGGDSPRFILDTHFHDDHINGNPRFRAREQSSRTKTPGRELLAKNHRNIGP